MASLPEKDKVYAEKFVETSHKKKDTIFLTLRMFLNDKIKMIAYTVVM